MLWSAQHAAADKYRCLESATAFVPLVSEQSPVTSEQVLLNFSEKTESDRRLKRTALWHQGKFVQCATQQQSGTCHAQETSAQC